MSGTKSTFCRICEPECSLIANFDANGKVVSLTPDLQHPSGGVACHKGLSFLDIHDDPDRLNWPQKRLNPKSEARGVFEEIGWDLAMTEAAEKLNAVREKYGTKSVAVYMGNPFGFNSAAVMIAFELQEKLQTPMRFSANTQDTSNRFAVVGAVYGSAEATMIPDLYYTDYLLAFGTNPKVSRWTLMTQPNNWEVIKDIKKRGGKVTFVNPRITESSTEETGPTLLIRPGTDVYFMAAILNEINITHGFDPELTAKYCKNVDALQAFVSRYPAERVASVTGIDAVTIKQVALDLVTARSAAIYTATGVNQSRQGMLCCWLSEMISVVTGNLGRRGGNFKPYGLFEHFGGVGATQMIETSIGAFELPDPIGYAVLPGALLPDFIESGDIRAMIVLGGNPLLSIGGGERSRRAYEKLETLVTMDIFRSATGELADYVFPATSWLERADINMLGSGNQPKPFVQYTEAMMEPAAGRKNEWWIIARLMQALGMPSMLDAMPDEVGLATVGGMLMARNLTVDQVLKEPSQTVMFDEGERNSLFERCLLHADKKIDCYPASFVEAGLMTRCEDIFNEFLNEAADLLKLISLRTPYLHNSWFSNSSKFRRGKNAENPLHMCEADAAALGLFAGEAVKVSSPAGELVTRILIDNDLGRGTVAMSHGFGQERSFALEVASKNPGANPNGLMPTGLNTYEPISYMSWLNGIPIKVERLVEMCGVRAKEAVLL